jgi:serine-type D-Ala-D-Ala endopeptidase (penicillin-binding protein 7)
VRVNRPSLVYRIWTTCLALGLAGALTTAETSAQTKPAAKSTPSKTTSTAKTTKKSSYSASASKARAARLSRARAAAKAREAARLKALQAAMTPRYKTDDSGELVPDVRAAAAIVFDPTSGEVLYESNGQDKRSIASITKVMTAIVFLEDNPDLSEIVTIQRSDVYAASTTYLRANERVSLDNLLHLTLIASDNAAARALSRVSHGGTAAFVERMNELAIELGLDSMSFADPSGLNPQNVSSAYDLSRLITRASQDERIAPIMRTAEYKVTTSRRSIMIHSTNRLVRDGDVDVVAGKTGFISKAGYCLATLLRLPQGNPVAVVVLGAGNNNGRFWETRHLFKWLSDKAGDLVQKTPDHPQVPQQ